MQAEYMVEKNSCDLGSRIYSVAWYEVNLLCQLVNEDRDGVKASWSLG
jgi:hypothetical protein